MKQVFSLVMAVYTVGHLMSYGATPWLRVDATPEVNLVELMNDVRRNANGAPATVRLAPGRYELGTNTLIIPPGCTVEGSGQENTIISGTVGYTTNVIVHMMSTSALCRVTVDAAKKGSYLQVPIGGVYTLGHTPSTNIMVRQVKVTAESDGMVFIGTNCSGTVIDSEFYAKWDNVTLLDPNEGDGEPGAFWDFRNVRIENDVSGHTLTAATNNYALRVSGAVMNLTDCTIIVTNHWDGTAVLLAGDTNYVRLQGGAILAAGTNTAYTVDNSAAPEGYIIEVQNCAVDQNGQAAGSVVNWRNNYNLLGATATINFPSIGSGGAFTNLVSVPGAAIGSPVLVGVPTNAVYTAGATNVVFSAEVHAPGVVSVRCSNNGSGAVDPPSGTFRVSVFNF